MFDKSIGQSRKENIRYLNIFFHQRWVLNGKIKLQTSSSLAIFVRLTSKALLIMMIPTNCINTKYPTFWSSILNIQPFGHKY